MADEFEELLKSTVAKSDIKEYLQEIIDEKYGEPKALILMWVDSNNNSRCGYVWPRGEREQLGLIEHCKDLIKQENWRWEEDESNLRGD